MPTHNMKRKDRIVMTRLSTRHCKLTHEYLLKKKTEPAMQPNFINQSSSIRMQQVPRSKAKIQNNFNGNPDAETRRKCPELSKGN